MAGCPALVEAGYVTGLPSGSTLYNSGALLAPTTLDAASRWYFVFGIDPGGGADYVPTVARVPYPSLDGSAYEEVHTMPATYVSGMGNSGILGLAYVNGEVYWTRNQSGFGTEHAGIYIEGGSVSSLPITSPTVIYGELVGHDPVTGSMLELQKIDELAAIGTKLYAVRRRGADAYASTSYPYPYIPPAGRPFTGTVTSEILEIDPATSSVTVLHTEVGDPVLEAYRTFYWGTHLGSPLVVDGDGGLWGVAKFSGGGYSVWRYDTVAGTFTQSFNNVDTDKALIIGTPEGSLLYVESGGFSDLFEIPGATMVRVASACTPDGFDGFGAMSRWASSPSLDIVAWVDPALDVWELRVAALGGWGVGAIRMGAN